MNMKAVLNFHMQAVVRMRTKQTSGLEGIESGGWGLWGGQKLMTGEGEKQNC